MLPEVPKALGTAPGFIISGIRQTAIRH